MIEVEKKFKLDEEQEKKLLADAEFLAEVTNVDTYFDNDRFDITTDDNWLRTRNDAFEYKKRLHQLGHKLAGTSYDELENDDQIRSTLNLQTSDSMIDDVIAAGFAPFATITTQRRSYKRESFHIDLDVCDFGYTLAEIELMVDENMDREEALRQIDAFAKKIGLDTSSIRGKVTEYIFRFRPEHYQALVDAGVM